MLAKLKILNTKLWKAFFPPLMSGVNSSEWLVEAVYFKYKRFSTFLFWSSLVLWTLYLINNFWNIVEAGGLLNFITKTSYEYTLKFLHMLIVLPSLWSASLAALVYVIASRYLPILREVYKLDYLKYALFSMIGLIFGFVGAISHDFVEMFVALEGVSMVIIFMFLQGFGHYSSESLFFRFFINNVYCTMLFSYGLTFLLIAGKSTDYREFRLFLLTRDLFSARGFLLNQKVDMAMGQWELFIFLGFICLIGSFLFKLGGYPFQSIIPDLFAGGTLFFLIYYVVFIKMYYIYILSKFVFGAFLGWSSILCPLLFIAGILSILHGTYATLFEMDFMRFVGTSSIPQMGFVLLGFSLANLEGLKMAYFFALVYVLTTFLLMYTFGSVVFKRLPTQHRIGPYLGSDEETGKMAILSGYPDFINWKDIHQNAEFYSYANGYHYVTNIRQRIRDTKYGEIYVVPYLTQAAAFCSFAALPPFIGFLSKYYLMLEYAATWPVFVLWALLLINLLSSFYYLRLVVYLVYAVRAAMREQAFYKLFKTKSERVLDRHFATIPLTEILRDTKASKLLLVSVVDLFVFRAMVSTTFIFSAFMLQAGQHWVLLLLVY